MDSMLKARYLYWKEKRGLKREIASQEKLPPTEESRVYKLHEELRQMDSDWLRWRVEQLGVDIESNSDLWFHRKLDGEIYSLTSLGRNAVSKLLREESRKTVEWWVKNIGGILVLLTGLIGTIIGLISVLRK